MDPTLESGLPTRRRNVGSSIQLLLHNHPTLGSLAVLIVAAAVFAIINPRFIQPGNLSILLQQVAVIGSLALAQTIIVLTAGIDLSVGAAMILVQLLMAILAVRLGLPSVLALVLGMLAAAATGLINGALVSWIKLPAFIVTLGTFSIFTAVGLLSSNGNLIQVSLSSFLNATGTYLGAAGFTLTTGVLVMIAMYLIVGYLLNRTAWGRHVYATGDDQEAARLAGIRTGRVLLSVYLVAGLVVGIAAWIQIGRVGSASTNISSTLNLDSITAVVIGGTSLFGGRGAVLGTLWGALIVEVFQNGLTLANVQDLYQQLAEGLLVLAAVGVDRWIRRARV